MSELPGDLERALRELEARAARRAAHVSSEQVASRVLARLRAEPAAGAGRWAPARRWVGLAAAAVLVVIAGTVGVWLAYRGGAERAPVPLVARGLDSLDVPGLERVLRVTDDVRPQVSGPVQVSTSDTWDDLSEAQLRAVLQAVQRSEGGTL